MFLRTIVCLFFVFGWPLINARWAPQGKSKTARPIGSNDVAPPKTYPSHGFRIVTRQPGSAVALCKSAAAMTAAAAHVFEEVCVPSSVHWVWWWGDAEPLVANHQPHSRVYESPQHARRVCSCTARSSWPPLRSATGWSCSSSLAMLTPCTSWEPCWCSSMAQSRWVEGMSPVACAVRASEDHPNSAAQQCLSVLSLLLCPVLSTVQGGVAAGAGSHSAGAKQRSLQAQPGCGARSCRAVGQRSRCLRTSRGQVPRRCQGGLGMLRCRLRLTLMHSQRGMSPITALCGKTCTAHTSPVPPCSTACTQPQPSRQPASWAVQLACTSLCCSGSRSTQQHTTSWALCCGSWAGWRQQQKRTGGMDGTRADGCLGWKRAGTASAVLVAAVFVMHHHHG